MADLVFARYTNRILDMLPYWFQIRKHSKDSIGARFLNVCGLELDDLRYVIDYAYEQCYIGSIDMNQVDFCYKTIVPMPLKTSELSDIYANNDRLIRAKDIKEFFGIDQHNIRDKRLHSFQFYYVDEKRNIVYVRKKFNADAVHDHGKIKLVFKDGKEYTRRLIPHHVWNFFDELGALVSCPRLFGEPNFEYKFRIMDVFINHAGASKPGLINGIGRELATRRVIHWNNPERDLELSDPMIVLNSINVNKEPIDPKRVFITEAGTVMLKAFEKDPPEHCHVDYVWGLEMHQLWNKEDIKLQNELFTVEGRAKEKLRHYINILNADSPIFWDHFHWNEHYWDQNEPDVSGVGFIPHLYDGSIRGFKSYGVISNG